MIHTYKPSIKGKKFRDPQTFIELPANERYLIPKSFTMSRIQNFDSKETI
jgi:hypothetical protein